MDSPPDNEVDTFLSLTPAMKPVEEMKLSKPSEISLNPELDTDEEMELKQAISLSLTPAGKQKPEVQAKNRGLLGYKFLPTDKQIMVFLRDKLDDPKCEFQEIKDANVYGHHPMILTGLQGSMGDNTWYFFYDRGLNAGKASWPKQTANKGYWKSRGEVSIFGLANTIGSKTSLDFIEETPDGCKIEWVMEQYQQANSKVNSNVVCKIYRIASRSVYDDNLTLSLSLSQGKAMNRKKLTAEHDNIFAPTDVELMGYLNRKIKDHNYSHQAITEANIYDHHPKKLIERYKWMGENCWIFFSPKDLSTYQSRTHRTAAGGFWHGGSAEKPVLDGKKEVGRKKHLTFKEGSRHKNKLTDWKMIEYRNASCKEVKSFVICKVYTKEVHKKPVKMQEDGGESCPEEKKHVFPVRRTV